MYELQRLQGLAQGQVVMQVADDDEAARWENIVGLAHGVAVRTPDRLFQQFMAEENLLTEIRIVGILHSNRTCEVAGVTFLGVTPSPPS